MANTYTWKIKQLECATSLMGNQNVVVKVYWVCEGASDQVKKEKNDFGYEFDVITTAKMENAISIEFAGGDFTPFEKLTETQVIDWVKSGLGDAGIAETLAVIDADIQAKLNPPIVKMNVPWN
jgi:hypothetical protein